MDPKPRHVCLLKSLTCPAIKNTPIGTKHGSSSSTGNSRATLDRCKNLSSYHGSEDQNFN